MPQIKLAMKHGKDIKMTTNNQVNNQTTVTITDSEYAELLELKRLQLARANKELTIKPSEKGVCCVYGLGQFPVSLYLDQWRKLAEFIPEVLTFIDKEVAKGDACRLSFGKNDPRFAAAREKAAAEAAKK